MILTILKSMVSLPVKFFVFHLPHIVWLVTLIMKVQKNHYNIVHKCMHVYYLFIIRNWKTDVICIQVITTHEGSYLANEMV